MNESEYKNLNEQFIEFAKNDKLNECKTVYDEIIKPMSRIGEAEFLNKVLKSLSPECKEVNKWLNEKLQRAYKSICIYDTTCNTGIRFNRNLIRSGLSISDIVASQREKL